MIDELNSQIIFMLPYLTFMEHFLQYVGICVQNYDTAEIIVHRHIRPRIHGTPALDRAFNLRDGPRMRLFDNLELEGAYIR